MCFFFFWHHGHDMVQTGPSCTGRRDTLRKNCSSCHHHGSEPNVTGSRLPPCGIGTNADIVVSREAGRNVRKIQMTLNVNAMRKHVHWPDLMVITVHFLFLVYSLTGVVHPDTGSIGNNDSTTVGMVGISSFSPSCIDLAGRTIVLQGTKVGTFIGILAPVEGSQRYSQPACHRLSAKLGDYDELIDDYLVAFSLCRGCVRCCCSCCCVVVWLFLCCGCVG